MRDWTIADLQLEIQRLMHGKSNENKKITGWQDS